MRSPPDSRSRNGRETHSNLIGKQFARSYGNDRRAAHRTTELSSHRNIIHSEKDCGRTGEVIKTEVFTGFIKCHPDKKTCGREILKLAVAICIFAHCYLRSHRCETLLSQRQSQWSTSALLYPIGRRRLSVWPPASYDAQIIRLFRSASSIRYGGIGRSLKPRTKCCCCLAVAHDRNESRSWVGSPRPSVCRSLGTTPWRSDGCDTSPQLMHPVDYENGKSRALPPRVRWSGSGRASDACRGRIGYDSSDASPDRGSDVQTPQQVARERRKATYYVAIEDKDFLAKIDRGERFSKSDMLLVDLRQVQRIEGAKLVTESVIVKMIEHRQPLQ